MNKISLSVETSEDRKTVIIGARCTSIEDVEDRNYILDPAMAVEVANSILQAAEICGVTVQVQTTGISDTKRLRLIQRTGHVIRSLAGKKVPYIAAQIVDTILTEVL